MFDKNSMPPNREIFALATFKNLPNCHNLLKGISTVILFRILNPGQKKKKKTKEK